MSNSLINKIQNLSPDDCTVIQKIDGPDGTLRVIQHGQYRWLQIADTNIQSIMHIGKPNRVLSPTTVLMLMGMAFTAGRSRLLNLGLGGGAIERSLRSSHPATGVDSVELDSRVIAAAREHFFLADDQSVYEQDAEEFVATCSERYDLVFVDLFSGGQSPDCVGRNSFFENINRCLAPGGVCVFNLLFSDQNALVKTLKAARTHLPTTWLAEVKEHQNVIAYFMRERTQKEAKLQRACETFLTNLNAEKLTFNWELAPLPNRSEVSG